MFSPNQTPKRIYLAGPMQGIPHFNFPRFHAVTAMLRMSGHTVFNPAEKDIERHDGVNIAAGNATGSLAEAQAEHGFSLRKALAQDMEFICLHAEVVLMLPGWETSAGATAEHRLATALKREGMEIGYLSEEVCAIFERAHARMTEAA